MTPAVSLVRRHAGRGFSLVELLVAMALTLLLVGAAAYVLLDTQQNQSALDRALTSADTASFSLELLGREIANAGFYPAALPPGEPMTASYFNPVAGQPTAYAAGLFGCEGGKFQAATAGCAPPVAGAPDAIVVNYFTADNFGSAAGQTQDCTGASVANDATNAAFLPNSGAPGAPVWNADMPPGRPLFVSNRFALNSTSMEVDDRQVTTQSLACSGNGMYKSAPGTAKNGYQPMLAGLDDLQLSYGIVSGEPAGPPNRFYNASEISALPPVVIDGQKLGPWEQVAAVKVCVLTRTLGGPARLADKAGSARTYVDCNEQTLTQSAADGSRKLRRVQVFGVRNHLRKTY